MHRKSPPGSGQLIVDDLELRGTIEVAVASAATALIALKAPDDKQSAYYAVAGLGLSTGLYKLVAAWTLEELPLSEDCSGQSRYSATPASWRCTALG